jgi:hypothetical protein
MKDTAKAFWDKSAENRIVSEDAIAKGHLNAAASRYYYALYLAIKALFEERLIPVPDQIRSGSGYVRNRFPDRWPKPTLHERAQVEIPGYKQNVERIMEDAWDLRVIADYKDVGVEPYEINTLKEDADGLFQVICNAINDK